jgi:hypothetical protein
MDCKAKSTPCSFATATMEGALIPSRLIWKQGQHHEILVDEFAGKVLLYFLKLC